MNFNSKQPQVIPMRHSGQVALVMVLIMTVVSAVAVSLAGRSTVDTRIQQMNVENTEALLTAQAGLEESIAKGIPVSGPLGVNGQYQVFLEERGSTGITSETINPGQVLEVNLEGVTDVSGIKIYWRAATAGGTPAIFVSDVRESGLIDYAFDTNGTGGFTTVVSGGSFAGVNYDYVTPSPISIAAGVSRKLVITVLGSAASLGVEPVGGELPSQVANYRAVGEVSSSTENTVKYGIEYDESKTDQLPPVFDYVLFSGGSISQ
jgi:hypothetical protein